MGEGRQRVFRGWVGMELEVELRPGSYAGSKLHSLRIVKVLQRYTGPDRPIRAVAILPMVRVKVSPGPVVA